MIKEHAVGTSVVVISKDVLIEFFGQMAKDLRTLKAMYEDMTDFKAGELSDDEYIDATERITFYSVGSFNRFAKMHISSNETLNIYIKRVAETFREFDKMHSSIVSTYCAPSEEELAVMMEEAYDVISGICFICGNEFLCYDLADAASEDDPEIDEIMYHHFSKYEITQERRHSRCIEFAKNISQLSAEFKMKLDVFDEAPEKEESFMRIVGPDICLIDSSRLTMPIVDAVLDGSMSLEQLREACMLSEEEVLDLYGDTTSTSSEAPKKMEV